MRRRALPAIALTAAGVTWLLHVQGHIDDTAAAGQAGSSPTPTTGAAPGPTAPSRATTTVPGAGRVPGGRSSTSTMTPSTTMPSGGGSGSSAAGAVPGSVVSTRYGDVQVAVVVTGGSQITDVQALQWPDRDRRSQSINNRALPTLRQEVLSAQSADVDVVSGATITTDAYEQSLQSALDAAGFHR